jgi:hypothetical protein
LTKPEPHRWEFRPRFRRHAFGWKSQPAIQRVRQAVAEIKKVARTDPMFGAEGAVLNLPCGKQVRLGISPVPRPSPEIRLHRGALDGLALALTGR